MKREEFESYVQAAQIVVAVKIWLQRAYVLALFLTTAAYGSPTPEAKAVSCLAFATLTLFSLAYAIGSLQVRRLYAVTTLLAATLIGVAFVQTWRLGPSSPLAHSAWSTLDAIVGGGRGSISVAPGMTMDALPTLALPFLVFLSGLSLFQSDADAARLWRVLAAFGLACAIFGIAQELAFPDMLLFEEKRYYRGSLTATFVNRNTAGTFFGVALMLNLSLFFGELKSVTLSTLAANLFNFRRMWPSANGRAILRLLGVLPAGVALFLTQSRGAVGATFIATVFAIFLFGLRKLTADGGAAAFAAGRRRFALIGALALVVGVFLLLGGRSAYRMQEEGMDDRWCAYRSTWRAIRDNGALGSGFGAFQDIFPMYRRADCAGVFGVWERAHNVYLEGLQGLGAVFAVALGVGIVLLVVTFVHGLRVRRALRFIPVGGLSAFCLAALHSLVDFSLQIPGFNVYFAAAMAAGVTVSLGR